jgi:hypothetical protein
MFTLHWTDSADTTYKQLRAKAEGSLKNRKSRGKKKSSKDEGLFKQIHKAVTLLQSNPRHPGLNTHEYDSIENPYDKQAKVFEAYAQNNTSSAYRVFWCYGPARSEITILAITPHP